MSDNNGGLYNLISAHEKRIAEQQARIEALEKAAMAVVNAYKPVSRNASAGPTALIAELEALLQEPTK